MKSNGRIHVHLYFSLSVSYPSTKIPGNLFYCSWIVFVDHFFSVASQVLKHIVSVWAVDVDFVSHRKCNSISINHVLFDFSIGCGFLIVELVAGESYNLQSMLFELSVYLH